MGTCRLRHRRIGLDRLARTLALAGGPAQRRHARHACLQSSAATRPRVGAVVADASIREAVVPLAGEWPLTRSSTASGMPWLALSGRGWFEWYFNRVPFRSIVPDTGRHPCFSQFAADVPDAMARMATGSRA